MGWLKAIANSSNAEGIREVYRIQFDRSYRAHRKRFSEPDARKCALGAVLAKWYEIEQKKRLNVNDPTACEFLMIECELFRFLGPPRDRDAFVEYLLFKKKPAEADTSMLRREVADALSKSRAESPNMPHVLFTLGERLGVDWVQLVDTPPQLPSPFD